MSYLGIGYKLILELILLHQRGHGVTSLQKCATLSALRTCQWPSHTCPLVGPYTTKLCDTRGGGIGILAQVQQSLNQCETLAIAQLHIIR